jgi:hypothetical protein
VLDPPRNDNLAVCIIAACALVPGMGSNVSRKCRECVFRKLRVLRKASLGAVLASIRRRRSTRPTAPTIRPSTAAPPPCFDGLRQAVKRIEFIADPTVGSLTVSGEQDARANHEVTPAVLSYRHRMWPTCHKPRKLRDR